ncbi:unnamed protein product [Thelazia callipaeda]|uniref:Dirigent protein n=1 Tax=Thelazia callipaeda TaxID=103827 RepID=A0A158RCC2_THECL|nr:unnamed protein product [Thelazia callipaeda]
MGKLMISAMVQNFSDSNSEQARTGEVAELKNGEVEIGRHQRVAGLKEWNGKSEHTTTIQYYSLTNCRFRWIGRRRMARSAMS